MRSTFLLLAVFHARAMGASDTRPIEAPMDFKDSLLSATSGSINLVHGNLNEVRPHEPRTLRFANREAPRDFTLGC
ncbi:hypothetical protein WOLCODRAFT_135221 [Wolfiporia cocos MD-104 SS10]|uniref:Uncharacterized protein n=1 Tax=Wolfiporia cocos (strain MD-104) TaxID=742152 RepID=A0A2H3J1E8_WOLCO|nr:hypothetical protein WOLCODRAFT_135221 [Wolfiporia cocos MD-104 SS10]